MRGTISRGEERHTKCSPVPLSLPSKDADVLHMRSEARDGYSIILRSTTSHRCGPDLVSARSSGRVTAT